MAISWGSWEGSSPTRIRVGIEVDWSGPVQHGWETVKATVKIYTDVEGNWSDTQTLNFGGSIGGSITFSNNQSNNSVLRETKTYTYTYGNNEYGSSPGSRTFTASLSGAFNGATPSKSVTSSIPKRPYAAPLAPNSVSITRVSDTSHKISWNNRETSGEPWDLVRVQIDVAANDVWNGDVGTPGGGATSFTDSGNSGANASYKYRVRSENSVGDSAWVETSTVHTTPAAPSSPTRSGTTVQTLSWANNVNATIPYQTEVWRSLNGAAFTLLKTMAEGATGTTDTVLASDKVKYKFRAKTNGGAQPTLYSSYSAETSESIGITTPPNAPTSLSPDGAIVNPTLNKAFTWQHNPTDGSAQTAYEIQWRVVGGAFTVVSGVSAAASHTFVGTTAAPSFPDNSSLEWQVRTKGANAAFGAWSALATFDTVSDPNQGRRMKRAVWLDLETGEQVTAPVGSLAPIGMLAPFAGPAAPPGWLMCQGQVVEQTAYPDLFGVIGTSFNIGGETGTQFRLPDLTGRFPLGAGLGIDGVTRARGWKGGQMTISASNLPPHSHTISHDHDLDFSSGTGSTGANIPLGTTTFNRVSSAAVGPSNTANSGDGPGSSAAMLPPAVAVNYIIKV